MDDIQEYYIVPKEVYEKCNEPEETLEQKISKSPARAKTKIRKLLEYLQEKIVLSDDSGHFPGYQSSVFDFLSYAVRGKKKPSEWERFVTLLVDAPLTLFCEKVKREVKKLKRKQNGKLHKASVD